MTTSEILEMAMQVATLGRTGGSDPVTITISKQWLTVVAGGDDVLGVCIRVAPRIDTESEKGTGMVEMSGGGTTIESAAHDLRRSVAIAEKAIRERTARRAEHGVTLLAKLDDATGSAAR